MKYIHSLFSKIQDLAIRKKVTYMTLFTVFGGLGVLLIYTGVTQVVTDLEKKAAIAADVVIRMAQVETNFNIVTLNLSRYISRAKNEYLAEENLAIEKADEALKELLALPLQDRVKNAIISLAKRQKEELYPIKDEIADVLENDGSNAALEVFDSKYNPLYTEIRSEITTVQAISRMGFDKARAEAERLSMIGKMGVGGFIIMGVLKVPSKPR